MNQNLDTRQEEYNKFGNFANISFLCIEYLMDNDEEIWKLLKYNNPDSWRGANLTKAEKAALVYDGSPNETDYRIFLDLAQDNSWTIEACILRISPTLAVPVNYVWGVMCVGFEVFCHYKTNTLSNYTTKIDSVSQRLIEVFNGAEIPTLGRLYFDYKASNNSRLLTIGSIPFKGRALVMCTQSLG